MRIALAALTVVGLLAAFAPVPADAQARRAEPARRAPERAVRAQPSARAALLLPAIQATRAAVQPRPERAKPAPAPLSPTLKARALSTAGGAAAGSRVAAPSMALDSVTLSAQRPYFAEKAYLSAVQPAEFDARTGVVELNINYGGWVNVHLNVEAGASYLVDLSTTTWGDGGTWRVEIGDETLEIAKGPGDEHVLFAVNAEETGWVKATVRRTGTGCRIHEIGIDRAN